MTNLLQTSKTESRNGFSLIELLIAMFITLSLMGLVTTLFSSSLGMRSRESRRTDALTAGRAALSSISREIGNSGYGITSNGIVTADSNARRIISGQIWIIRITQRLMPAKT